MDRRGSPRGRRPARRPLARAVARARRLLRLVVAVAALVAVGSIVAAAIGDGGGSPASGPLDRSLFAAGACEAFAPTHGDRGRTVFLDAGHGGVDPGGVGVTEAGVSVSEAAQTLPVELDAMALLRARGFRVVVSRTRNSTVLALRARDESAGSLSVRGVHDDIAARDRCANMSGAAALVGIYFDASASPATAGSLSAWDAARSFAAANHALADLLQRDVLAAMNAHGWGIPDDGVVADGSLGSLAGNPAGGGLAARAAAYHHLLLLGPAMSGYFSTPSRMPGSIIEPLYITDPYEATIAASPAGQAAIARGIADAVTTFLGR